METNKLDELAMDLAEKYGVSIEEAREVIRKATIAFKGLAEAWKTIWDRLKEAAMVFEELQMENSGPQERWPVVWDTR
ncbi:hypothetical protein ACFVSW_20120 [Neobacillus sp. NPDC058068]|uniref:hypothetical protein n=1 Tax=Neobacillus sp. NPDC058068 TaxID=3346325 RepID=UPI0036D7A056